MPEVHVFRRNLFLILATTTALSALALSAARARDVPKIATGFVANVLCSETFVSGLEPDRIRLGYGVYGKPFLDVPGGAANSIQFNVSHSDGLAVFAVTCGRAVGIDVERIRPELVEP